MRSSPAKLAYDAAYKANHREETSANHVAYNEAHREEKRQEEAEFHEWLQLLRAVNGCEDCETHEGKLEHHHVDPSTKTYNISEMYTDSREKFLDEVAKCAVLCRSCHLKRHAEMRALAA